VTLPEDLTAWVAERPDWQKDVVARFCRNESLADQADDEIADYLIAAAHSTARTTVASDHAHDERKQRALGKLTALLNLGMLLRREFRQRWGLMVARAAKGIEERRRCV